MPEPGGSGGRAHYGLDDKGQIAVTYSEDGVILVTEDRLRRRLMEHLGAIGDRAGWVAPLGIVISLVLALCTSTFRDALTVPASVWNALFLLLLAASGVWLIVATIKALRAKASLDGVIQVLRADTASPKPAVPKPPSTLLGRRFVTNNGVIRRDPADR